MLGFHAISRRPISALVAAAAPTGITIANSSTYDGSFLATHPLSAFNTAGTNPYLLVASFNKDPATEVTSTTADGSNMTNIDSNSNATVVAVQGWGIIPADSSTDIVSNTPAFKEQAMIALNLNGVNQTTPYNTTTVKDQGFGTTATAAITGTAGSKLIIIGSTQNDRTLTVSGAGVTQVQQFNHSGGIGACIVAAVDATGSSQTIGFTINSADNYRLLIIEIFAASSGSNSYTRNPSDTATLSDAITKAIALFFSDSSTSADVTTKAVTKPTTDSVAASDLATTTSGKGVSVSDSVTTSDARTLAVTLSKADTGASSDTVTRSTTKRASDTSTTTDANGKAVVNIEADEVRVFVGDVPAFNGDFENYPTFVAPTTTSNRFIDGTAGGSATDLGYFWRFGRGGAAAEAFFDTTEKFSGSASLKISTKAVGAFVEVRNALDYNTPAPYGFPMMPSKSYTLVYRMRTNYVSGDSANGANLAMLEANAAGTNIGSAKPNAVVKTTQPWTLYVQTWTSNASAFRGHVEPRIYGHTGAATLIMDAWFDDIIIMETAALIKAVGKSTVDSAATSDVAARAVARAAADLVATGDARALSPVKIASDSATSTDAVSKRPVLFDVDSVVASTGKTNFATNPSFETDLATWTVYAGASVTRITTDVMVGNASARVVNAAVVGGGGSAGGINRIFTLLPNRRYTASAWVKLISGSMASLQIYSAIAGDTTTTTPIVLNQWIRISHSFTTTSGGFSNQIYFRAWGTNQPNAIWLIDGIVVEEGSTPSPYFEGTVESTVMSVGKVATDAATSSDVPSKSSTRVVTDTATTTDALSKVFGKYISDTSSTADDASTYLIRLTGVIALYLVQPEAVRMVLQQPAPVAVALQRRVHELQIRRQATSLTVAKTQTNITASQNRAIDITIEH